MADGSTHSETPRSERAAWRSLGFCALLVLLVWRFLVSLTSSRDAARPALARTTCHPQERPKTAFEPTDWAVGPVFLLYLGILALLVVSSFVLIAAYPDAISDVDRRLRIAPPGPRLQTDAEGDLRRFRAEEERRLNTYYWIDKQKGVVHIPIQEAMKKLARTGAPGFPQGQQ